MSLMVRLVNVVTLVFVLFHENGSAIRIAVTDLSYKDDARINENLQPIEHGSEEVIIESISKDIEKLTLEENEENINKVNDVPLEKLEAVEVIGAFSTSNKHRVPRQVKGHLYPHLGSVYGSNQYYPSPRPDSANQWNRNSYNSSGNNVFHGYNSSNPLSNITFSGYPSQSYPSSQNNYYNNPSSSYNNPQGPTQNSQWNRNPYNNSFPSNPLANVTFNGYPSASYPSQNNYYNNNRSSPYTTQIPTQISYVNFNNSNPYNPLSNVTFNGYPASQSNYYNYPSSPYNTSQRPTQNVQWNLPKNNNSYPSNPLSNGTFNGYPAKNNYNIHNRPQRPQPMPSPYNPGSYRPPQQNHSAPWQGNSYNTGYNTSHQYGTTSPRYPQSQYPANIPRNSSYGGQGSYYNNYNHNYPSPPPINTVSPRPYPNQPSYNPQPANSYGNHSRPTSYPSGYNNYNPTKYQNNTNPLQPYGNNNSGVYPNASPSYNNGPSYGGYPSPSNGHGQNNWNPGPPSNGHENPNLFNYPPKYNTSMYDPRKNPPEHFSY